MPALAAAAEAYAEENPALLALEPELIAAEVEMTDAAAAYLEAFRIGDALWPEAPASIAWPWKPSRWEEYEHDIEGFNQRDRPGIWTSQSLHWETDRIKRWRKVTPEREAEKARVRKLCADVEAYEKACAEAKAAGGFDAAHERRKASWAAMRKVVDRVQAEPARTMAGVRIKARTARAWSAVPKHELMMEALEGNLTGDLAASLLAVLEG
ncbi:MAG: hypothetical protein INR68_18215 [Methylobacterium mesophilicum]|nr:hypothetical protein [Methylobacterium mesophilicum]